MTGLESKQRKDTRLMNRIAKFTRLDPHKRYQYIQALAHKIVKEAKNQWGIEIEDSAPTVTAHILKPPRIRIGVSFLLIISYINFSQNKKLRSTRATSRSEIPSTTRT